MEESDDGFGLGGSLVVLSSTWDLASWALGGGDGDGGYGWF